MNEKTTTFAKELLDQLIQLDKTMGTAYYEMGRILASFKRDKLYDLIGYKSFGEMVDEELSFSPNTAQRHILAYEDFQRLHYTKAEALEIIHEFGWTTSNKILHKEKAKLSKKALRKKLDEMDVQVNFVLSPADYDETYDLFVALGVEVSPETGRWKHSSEVFMSLVRSAAKTATKAA